MSLQWLSETCRPGARANSSVKKKKTHRKLWEDSTYNRKFFLGSLNQTKQCLFVLGGGSTTTFYMSDVAFAHFPLKAFVTSADGPKRSLWWGPDRLFWVFTPELIYKQSGRSPGGAWWFLTSRQADVQRAWIKHTASSDHGLQAFRESNEIWAVISIHKKKQKKQTISFCQISVMQH